MKKIILAGCLAVVLIFIAFNFNKKGADAPTSPNNPGVAVGEPNPSQPDNKKPISDSKALCEAEGGAWDAKYKECTGIDSNSCTKIGGNFNECASACRHDPNAEVCTMQCVLVCEL